MVYDLDDYVIRFLYLNRVPAIINYYICPYMCNSNLNRPGESRPNALALGDGYS